MVVKPPAPAKTAGKGPAPGSAAYRAMQRAPRPAPVIIDPKTAKAPLGGKPIVVGKRHIEVKDRRTRDTR
jgi:hypothetical protein